ncbi:hypothetical protein BT63DRAFT_268547 [Microthyrium microscopicum]|uniref:Uncharacterized protein n=1 Tax=Microthyrium microscopicum TaxID=703497 RepID=A0A6A6U9Y6_9PEZI|nr:hypothetical protein BT63DRAFT_268547 [Microthyrium microscopicum]
MPSRKRPTRAIRMADGAGRTPTLPNHRLCLPRAAPPSSGLVASKSGSGALAKPTPWSQQSRLQSVGKYPSPKKFPAPEISEPQEMAKASRNWMACWVSAVVALILLSKRLERISNAAQSGLKIEDHIGGCWTTVLPKPALHALPNSHRIVVVFLAVSKLQAGDPVRFAGQQSR